MTNKNIYKSNSGFTLLELLVTLVIFAILVAIAVPSMNNLGAKNAVKVPARTLLTDIEYARNEAVSRGTDITICASTNAATCSPNPNWETGWIIFINDANDCPEGECLLRIQNESSQITLNSSAVALQFNELGESSVAFTANVCGTNLSDDDSQAISVNLSGSRSIREGAAICPP